MYANDTSKESIGNDQWRQDMRQKPKRWQAFQKSWREKWFLPLWSMPFAHLHFWTLFTLRSIYKEKKKISWNLQSAYFWKPPSKIAWLSTHHQSTSALLDPCLLGVEGEIRDSLDQTWDHSGVTGGHKTSLHWMFDLMGNSLVKSPPNYSSFHICKFTIYIYTHTIIINWKYIL